MLLRLLQDLFGGAAAREESRARAALEETERRAASEHFDRSLAARSQGRMTDAYFELTRAVELTGDRARGLEHCRELRRAAPDLQPLDMLEAQLRFEGDWYFEVLRRLLDELKPRTYLEIGVAAGDSLKLAKAPTTAIGVDPKPEIAFPLEPNQRVFAETSDAFFAGRDVRAEFGGQPVDLAFIDGMHHFEFALRDFANTERLCTPRSTILIHDCYPLDRATAERDRRRSFWTGDVWRLVVLLKKVRPELAIHTIATAPTGLTMVRKLDPSSRLLMERHDELCREFLALDYSYLESDMPGKLNLFPNDWPRVRALLQ
jgi:hypothetical protein